LLLLACILSTASTNGILVQQHIGRDKFFNRSWNGFKVGFGNATGNYWIGNQRLHQLTKRAECKLRVDLLAKFNNRWYWAEYDRFSIGDEETAYALLVGGYSGNAGDGMNVDGIPAYNLNGVKFSTYDRENDDSGNCAHPPARRVSYKLNYIGGFWYMQSCGYALLNQNSEFQWKSLPIGTQSRDNDHVALAASRMK